MFYEENRRLLVEEKMLQRGWAIKLDRHPIVDRIGFLSQMYSDPEERIAFIAAARDVLEEVGVLSQRSRKVREAKRAQEKATVNQIESNFQKEGWPIRLTSTDSVERTVFFETQCKERFPEERHDFIVAARRALHRC